MKKKLLKCLGWSLLSGILFAVIIVFEINSWPAGNSIAGAFLGLVLPALVKSYQDLSDNTAWKTTQRQLERGKLISDDSIIRISFAYLYRIKVGNKYLLVLLKIIGYIIIIWKMSMLLGCKIVFKIIP